MQGPSTLLHDVHDRDGARLSYEEPNTRATTHTYAGGVTIRVAALTDIVASKQWAYRPKDHRALPELEGAPTPRLTSPPDAKKGTRTRPLPVHSRQPAWAARAPDPRGWSR